MCTVHDGEPELARLPLLRKSQIKGLLIRAFPGQPRTPSCRDVFSPEPMIVFETKTIGHESPRRLKRDRPLGHRSLMMELLVDFQCDSSKKNTSPEIGRPGDACRAEVR
jgi:hypothetical protein